MKLTTAEAIAELQKVDTIDMPARLCEAHYMAIEALKHEIVIPDNPTEKEIVEILHKLFPKYRWCGFTYIE